MPNTFKSVARELPASSTSSNVYICPANTTAIVTLCQASNKSNANYPITMQWIDISQSSTAYKLLNTVTVPAYASLGCIDGKLMLSEGDYIQAWSNSTTRIDLTVSVMEIT